MALSRWKRNRREPLETSLMRGTMLLSNAVSSTAEKPSVIWYSTMITYSRWHVQWMFDVASWGSFPESTSSFFPWESSDTNRSARKCPWTREIGNCQHASLAPAPHGQRKNPEASAYEPDNHSDCCTSPGSSALRITLILVSSRMPAANSRCSQLVRTTVTPLTIYQTRKLLLLDFESRAGARWVWKNLESGTERAVQGSVSSLLHVSAASFSGGCKCRLQAYGVCVTASLPCALFLKRMVCAISVQCRLWSGQLLDSSADATEPCTVPRLFRTGGTAARGGACWSARHLGLACW